MSLTATQKYHKPMDAATKIFPSVAPCALDPEQQARQTLPPIRATVTHRTPLPPLPPVPPVPPLLPLLSLPPLHATAIYYRYMPQVRETALQCLRVYMSVIERAAANVGKPQADEAEAGGAAPVKDDLSMAADKVQ